MLSKIRTVVGRARRFGLRDTTKYVAYRFYDACQLGRFGIRRAVKAAMDMVDRQRLGVTNPECYSHNPSPSFYIFRRAMRRFVLPTADDVFLDYGSGLGTVLLMASLFPFRRIIGVEYSAALNARAEEIIAGVRERLVCPAVELVTADAAEYPLPAEVTVIYFFNPFGGALLARVCETIRQSLAEAPRDLRIVYYSPDKFEQAVAGAKWLEKLGEVRIPAITPYATAVYRGLPQHAG
jgi:SAM-dependent methyltransferase